MPYWLLIKGGGVTTGDGFRDPGKGHRVYSWLASEEDEDEEEVGGRSISPLQEKAGSPLGSYRKAVSLRLSLPRGEDEGD